MSQVIGRRIIGDSPPQFGGKKAVSLVMPWHKGECSLSYEFDGINRRVRFCCYKTARTAAIQAIFSAKHGINNVCVEPVSQEFSKTPLFNTAKDWLAEHEAKTA